MLQNPANVTNKPFAQLLPGLETGHPLTVGRSTSVLPTSRKLFLLSPLETVLSAIHTYVIDQPSPDAPSLTQAIIVQMVYSRNIPVTETPFTNERTPVFRDRESCSKSEPESLFSYTTRPCRENTKWHLLTRTFQR